MMQRLCRHPLPRSGHAESRALTCLTSSRSALHKYSLLYLADHVVIQTTSADSSPKHVLNHAMLRFTIGRHIRFPL